MAEGESSAAKVAALPRKVTFRCELSHRKYTLFILRTRRAGQPASVGPRHHPRVGLRADAPRSSAHLHFTRCCSFRAQPVVWPRGGRDTTRADIYPYSMPRTHVQVILLGISSFSKVFKFGVSRNTRGATTDAVQKRLWPSHVAANKVMDREGRVHLI